MLKIGDSVTLLPPEEIKKHKRYADDFDMIIGISFNDYVKAYNNEEVFKIRCSERKDSFDNEPCWHLMKETGEIPQHDFYFREDMLVPIYDVVFPEVEENFDFDFNNLFQLGGI